MNKDTFKGNWKEIQGKVKQKWGKLTDNDVTQINGRYEELEGKLQKIYGFQKEQAEREIDQFLNDNEWD